MAFNNQCKTESREQDIAFLREMRDRLAQGRAGDSTQLDYLEQMISDWLHELTA